MIVRELITKLGFKTDEGAVKKYEGGIKSLTTAYVALSAAVTVAAAGMFAFVDSAAKTGDELDKIKRVVGLSTKHIQLLGGAAALSGIEHDNFIISMQFFSKSVGMARMGMMEQLKAFQMLGISLRGANGQVKSQYKLLLEVADGFKNLKNQQDKATVSQLLFSRGGGKMLNIFANGSQGIKDLTKKVAKYAFLMDKEAIEKSAKFTDTMYLVELAIKGVKDQIGLALMPMFQKMLGQTLKWITANRKLLALRLKEFFKGLVVVTVAVGKTFAFLVSTFAFLVGVLKIINANFGILAKLLEGFIALKIVSKIKLIRQAFGGLMDGIAFLITPLGMMMAGFVAMLLVLDDVNAYFEGKDSLIGRFMKRFPKATAAIGEAIRPIKLAIETFVIDPLMLIIKLMNKIDSMVGSIMPKGGFRSVSLGEGTSISQGSFGLPTLHFGTPNAIVRGQSGNSHQININTHVSVSAPAGTSSEQQSFLQSAAKDSFHSNFSNEIKKALISFPGVEK